MTGWVRKILIALLALIAGIGIYVLLRGPPPESIADRYPPDRTIAFRQLDGDRGPNRIFMHVFLPPPGVEMSDRTIILFHGGGWKKGTPLQFFRRCRWLADLGYGCVSGDYRTRKSHGTNPMAALDDAVALVDFTVINRSRLGLPEGDIWVGGASAGATLALLVAGERADQVQGALLLNPILDLSPGSEFHEPTKDLGERFRPLEQGAKVSVPVLLMNGTADTITPARYASRLSEQLKEQNEEVDFRLFEGAPHGFFDADHGEQTDALILDFLERH